MLTELSPHWIKGCKLYLIASRGWNLYQLFRLAHSLDNICLWLPEEQKSVNAAATRQPSQLLSWPYFFAPLIGLLDEDNWPSICIAMFVLEVLDWEKVYLVKFNLRYQSRRHEVDNQQEERHHWIIVKNGNNCCKIEIIFVRDTRYEFACQNRNLINFSNPYAVSFSLDPPRENYFEPPVRMFFKLPLGRNLFRCRINSTIRLLKIPKYQLV